MGNKKIWITINILIVVALIIWIAVVTEEEDQFEGLSETMCLHNIDCIEERWGGEGERTCERAIQDAAPWDYEWTDSFTYPKFSHIGIGTAREFRLMGDRIKFSNQYNAWQHMAYVCWYDPRSKQARTRAH